MHVPLAGPLGIAYVGGDSVIITDKDKMLPFELRVTENPTNSGDGYITVCERNAEQDTLYQLSTLFVATQTPRVLHFCLASVQFAAFSRPYKIYVYVISSASLSELTEQMIKVVFGSDNCNSDNTIASKELLVAGKWQLIWHT